MADALIGRAGRTTLVLALRGSRSQRVLRYMPETIRGYGSFRGVPEAEVLARIDRLIADRILRLEYCDGFPLLDYTSHGLELAQRFAAEDWLETLRARVQPVAAGAPLELPFLLSVMPDRNGDTVLLLVDLVAREADRSWIPLLRAWAAAETRRVRAQLGRLSADLEAGRSPASVPPPASPGVIT